MLEKNIALAHEPDAAWIIALWKAIHGGDPGPEQVAASVVAVMAPYVGRSAETFSAEQMAAGFEALGVTVSQPPVEEFRETGVQYRQYCFKFQGKTICITLQLPKVAVQSAA